MRIALSLAIALVLSAMTSLQAQVQLGSPILDDGPAPSPNPISPTTSTPSRITLLAPKRVTLLPPRPASPERIVRAQSEDPGSSSPVMLMLPDEISSRNGEPRVSSNEPLDDDRANVAPTPKRKPFWEGDFIYPNDAKKSATASKPAKRADVGAVKQVSNESADQLDAAFSDHLDGSNADPGNPEASFMEEATGKGSNNGTKPSKGSRSFFADMFGTIEEPACEPAAGRKKFQSNIGVLPNVASPVTNPFLAEDPRSITEIRPIYLYQAIPSSNYLYRGGAINYFGVQARFAVTDRISFVLNKLGGINFSPGDGSLLGDESGFAEVWFGPKFTFINDGYGTGTVAAAGVQFQIPTGGATTYQDTGSSSITPWVSVTQKLWETKFGTFNLHDTFGYSFSTDDMRSDYLYNSLHLDLDVGNYNRFFPLVELNWTRYTTSGAARPFFGFEGGDLANVGSASEGTNYLTIAPGARFKFGPENNRDRFQIGAAAEFPLIDPKDLQDFRLTFDFIFRY
ncbi:transporter [Tuwongella immobilis]|uniref:Secreted protein n=1 Tax=Tuwongella immobilis TaxID=692036 RepID=A0A6C2YP55_9BACT|nr:transporter [Tuwongella immobilis]VIP02835.1 Signal peptide-domain containing protein OS=Planctomyces brasiliensis (strain ATCC 49424 / DSM 5305 / JCM 21570 / NBRC 103401 / IFAM 1448) GN=Plabr_3056 PE=4 SV=1: Phenol_MetA_deg [Tuwongella immobilis]VTS02593.1 Signal peptide-domain containing protein OS=Planctomyces brasiliensis (strain ATCC 49424 / DSM 5305 / JCM 21570 / NBRC 103401 / IFAM 1448) GN=Plabr_3056 PE=4 SV=1: Phenol_MetA_deg [Tuwongella immobilis]